LRDLWIPVAAITADDQEGTFGTFWDGEEDGGNEVLGVIWLLEDLDLLSKTRAVDVVSEVLSSFLTITVNSSMNAR
jgi:hypothetical protein